LCQLVFAEVDSVRLLSLSPRPPGAPATLLPTPHPPLATRAPPIPPPSPITIPAPGKSSSPPAATATPRNGLYIAGTYNGSMFDQTTQQTTSISVLLVQSEGNAALSGTVTFKSPSQGVNPLHGTVDRQGNL